ncbi:MAG: site-2 protease family protein [Candidatus Kerfeldbacteria bacterium]|nr:site-2 protease family protein [Candidatus Kerfeldbacteria bacterium]
MLFQLLFTDPSRFIVWVAAIIYAITVHEFMHAYSGVAQGDPTPKNAGRLSLNPLAHIDPMGLLFLLFVGFGWGKPVPFNPYFLRNARWGPFWVAFAGPLSNLVSAFLFGGILKISVTLGISPDNLLVLFLVALIHLNIILFLFNLLPIPPLDGSKIWYGLFPRLLGRYQPILERYGQWILFGIILIDLLSPVSIFGALFDGISEFVFKWFT